MNEIKFTPVYIEGWVNMLPFIAFEIDPPPKDMEEAKAVAESLTALISIVSKQVEKRYMERKANQ
jgi:hypothetical protein